MRHLLAVVVVTAAILLLVEEQAAADTFTDPGFATERVATVRRSLVGMAFAPDGRMFVWQKNGVVRDRSRTARCCRHRSST